MPPHISSLCSFPFLVPKPLSFWYKWWPCYYVIIVIIVYKDVKTAENKVLTKLQMFTAQTICHLKTLKFENNATGILILGLQAQMDITKLYPL